MSSIPPSTANGAGSSPAREAQSLVPSPAQRAGSGRLTDVLRKCPCFFLFPNQKAHSVPGRKFCRFLVDTMKEVRELRWPKPYFVVLKPDLQKQELISIKRAAVSSPGQAGQAFFSERAMLMKAARTVDTKFKETYVLLFPRNEEGESSRKTFLEHPERESWLPPLDPDAPGSIDSIRISYYPKSDGALVYSPELSQPAASTESAPSVSSATNVSASSQSRNVYHHTEFKKYVKQVKFDLATQYLQTHQPLLDDEFDRMVYNLDESYCFRRKRQFQKAAELLSKVIETVTLKISEVSGDAKAMPWYVLRYLALVNRAKCNIKYNLFDAVEADLAEIEGFKLSLPAKVGVKMARAREVKIELLLRMAVQVPPRKDPKEAFTEAAEHAEEVVKAYEEGLEEKKYLLGRAYEIQCDVLSKLALVQQNGSLEQLKLLLSAYEKVEKAYAVYGELQKVEGNNFGRYLEKAEKKKGIFRSCCLDWVEKNRTIQLDKKTDELIQTLREGKPSEGSSNSSSSSSSSSSSASSG